MPSHFVRLSAAAACLSPLFLVAACGGAADDSSSSAADLSADHHKLDAGAPPKDASTDAGSDDDTCDEATFVFFADGAQQVWVAGTFTTPTWAGANEGALPMTQIAPSLWSLDAHFPTRARHLYKFITDSNPAWQRDPLNPEYEPDGTGLGYNSVVNHYQVFAYPICSGTDINVTGNFTTPPWSSTGDGLISVFIGNEGQYNMEAFKVPSGANLYKFIVGTNPDWATDPYNPVTVGDGFGGLNSVVHTCHE